MLLEELIKNLPLLSASAMYAIVAIQMLRDRFRTWTESFFLAGFFLGGTYALTDLMFFTAQTYEAAFFAAKMSLGALSLCVLFFYLFTAVFLKRMKRELLFTALPTAMALVIVWGGMLTGVRHTNWGWVAVYDSSLFLTWILYVVVYILLGIWNMQRCRKVAEEMSATVGSRTKAIEMAFMASLFLGLGTNGYFALAGLDAVPLFSTFVMIPGLATLAVVVPLTREKVANAAKQWKSSRYEVTSTYLVHADGTLINHKSSLPEMNVDRDIFTATLDVIQNFMKTSFPYLSGKWLRSIDHGDTKILLERGKFTFLVVVIKGEDNDILRRQMKDLLSTFEAKNSEKLMHWRGISQDAQGTDQVMNAFFAREVLF